MTIYKSIVIQPANKLLVRVWDSKKPHRLESRFDTELHYQAALDNWLKSYKEYEVHPDYVDRVNGLVIDQIVEKCMDISIDSLLKQGIEIDPDLIYIEKLLTSNDKGIVAIEYANIKDNPVESEEDLYLFILSFKF